MKISLAGRILFVSLSIMVLLISACKPDLVSRPETAFQATHAWLAEHRAIITYGLPGQEVDTEQAFRQGYILVYAEGLPKQGVDHAGQKRLTAQRAAEVKAQQGLAHVLAQGERFASLRLQGFRIVTREYSSELEKAAVLLRHDLQGVK